MKVKILNTRLKGQTILFCFYDASGVACEREHWCMKRFGGKV